MKIRKRGKKMPKIWGIEHIFYLIFWTILGVATICFIKKKIKDEKTLTIITKCIGLLLFMSIIWNRISIAVVAKSALKLFPESFCGTTSLVFSLAIIFGKKDNIVLHSVAYFGIVGGLITIFYPDFIGQAPSIFHSRTISGLVHHTLTVYLFVLIILTKSFRPTYKKWYAVVLGGTCFMTYGLFLIKVIGLPDAMLIENPILSGTKLYWYAICGIFLLLYGVFIASWEVIKILIERKKQN
jgi:hypothetical protein